MYKWIRRIVFIILIGGGVLAIFTLSEEELPQFVIPLIATIIILLIIDKIVRTLFGLSKK